MTLEEAILHAREKAKELRDEIDVFNEGIHPYGMRFDRKGCEKCAREHEQLAEWLEELKEIREVVNEFTSTHTRPYVNRMEMAIAFCVLVLIVKGNEAEEKKNE